MTINLHHSFADANTCPVWCEFDHSFIERNRGASPHWHAVVVGSIRDHSRPVVLCQDETAEGRLTAPYVGVLGELQSLNPAEVDELIEVLNLARDLMKVSGDV